MKRENAFFLAGGFAFGAIFGIGVYNAVTTRPELAASSAASGEIPAPAGPMAPTAGGGPADPNAQGGAPMVAEVNRLKTLLQQNPRNLEALMGLAHVYHDAAMWPQAAGYYQRAIEISPQNADLYSDLGVCFRGQAQYDKALEAFEHAQRISPGHWQSLFNIAVVTGFDTAQYDRAAQALQVLEKLSPRPPEVDQLKQAIEQRRAQGAPAKAGAS
ncbi:MAG TPA: tetratricopeptide repeat protein [Candidatus Polarisedimenticolaceae bacterium]|nr:tetratricopeptide repeat protein [Candidatus Polarisedimenticolaceae bacterium]